MTAQKSGPVYVGPAELDSDEDQILEFGAGMVQQPDEGFSTISVTLVVVLGADSYFVGASV